MTESGSNLLAIDNSLSMAKNMKRKLIVLDGMKAKA